MALAHLDGVEPVVAHVEAEEHTAIGALAQVLDYHILVHKCHPAQLRQIQAGGLPAHRCTMFKALITLGNVQQEALQRGGCLLQMEVIIHSFIHLFVRSFVRSFVHACIQSCTHSVIYSLHDFQSTDKVDCSRLQVE